MTSGAEKPLTEEDLRVLLAVPLSDLALAEMKSIHGTLMGVPITRLVAEVRRLRSETWLEKAAEEIEEWHDFSTREVGDTVDPLEPWRIADRAEVLTILRKHRDGKP